MAHNGDLQGGRWERGEGEGYISRELMMLVDDFSFSPPVHVLLIVERSRDGTPPPNPLS